MKLKNGFILHRTEDECVMVATGKGQFNGMVRLNETAAFFAEQLKKEVTEKEIVDAAEQNYDAPRDVLEKDVRAVLEKLRSVGAIEE